MVVGSNDDLVKALLKALGAPPFVRSFELRAAVDEMVTVTIEYFPEVNGVALPDTVTEEYELVRRSPTKVSPTKVCPICHWPDGRHHMHCK